MADVTINALSPITPATGLFLPASDSNTTGRVTLSQVCGVMTSAQITTALGYTPYNGATNPNGYITNTNASVAKAWVNFNGTVVTVVGAESRCEIRSSYNVSKVVRNTTGDYSVYFTTSFANANYCAQVTSGTNSVLGSNAPTAPAHCIGTQAVGNIRVFTYNPNTGAGAAGLVNRAIVNVAIWS